MSNDNDKILAEATEILRNVDATKGFSAEQEKKLRELGGMIDLPALHLKNAKELAQKKGFVEGTKTFQALVDFQMEVEEKELECYGHTGFLNKNLKKKAEAHEAAVEKLLAVLREDAGEVSNAFMEEIEKLRDLCDILGPVAFHFNHARQTMNDDRRHAFWSVMPLRQMCYLGFWFVHTDPDESFVEDMVWALKEATLHHKATKG